MESGFANNLADRSPKRSYMIEGIDSGIKAQPAIQHWVRFNCYDTARATYLRCRKNRK